MQLNELGEFGLIGLIREKFASVSAAGYEGIGDDCAVMPCGDGTSLVVTTDMLIEEVHFRLCTTDPYRLGRKSLAVNLSDIAAMGAAPAASFLSIALPPDTAVEWVERSSSRLISTRNRTCAKAFGSESSGPSER